MAKNWLFQGFFDLSVNEKLYKILFDLAFIIGAILAGMQGFSLVIVFLVGHTVNWVTNDHFVDNLFHLHVCKMTPEKMEKSIAFLRAFVNRFRCIEYAGIYGRIARGEEVHAGTDIDIRFLKKKGFVNSLKVCFIGHYLRCMALFRLIPIDLNIWNDVHDLKRMRKDENPLILKGHIKVQSLYIASHNNMLKKYQRFDCRFA
jgi:hypothetical protein